MKIQPFQLEMLQKDLMDLMDICGEKICLSASYLVNFDTGICSTDQ